MRLLIINRQSRIEQELFEGFIKFLRLIRYEVALININHFGEHSFFVESHLSMMLLWRIVRNILTKAILYFISISKHLWRWYKRFHPQLLDNIFDMSETIIDDMLLEQELFLISENLPSTSTTSNLVGSHSIVS